MLAVSGSGSSSAASVSALQVLTEPKDGLGAIYRFITRARSSVDLTMYELADASAEKDLAADAARGVDVRVILDRHFEQSANRSAYRYLAAHGVACPPGSLLASRFIRKH
jgi:cardiolipin synthase A/B